MLKETEILAFINQDLASNKKRIAEIGRRYYEGEHDIRDYRMFYFNADGKLVEDNARSNVKISHPFFTELVDQQVQYMLSNGEGFVKSDDPALQKRLNEYFDDDFVSELQEVMTDAISCGFSFMYAYEGKDEKLHFENAECKGVVEVKGKDTDDGNDYVIYHYQDYTPKDNLTIRRIQVWNKTETWYYVQENNGKIELDHSEPINPRPHIIYQKDDDPDTYYDSFGYIPFFRLDNNRNQVSGVKPIKDIIDDYDVMSCGLSNNLKDFDHPLYIVKGFKGDNLDELQQNLKTKKIIGTDDTGGVDVKTIDVPYQARQAKMQEDEKNIYRFGMGFNSSQLGDGNVTNVVIKSRYALLDLKSNKFEIKLRQFLKKIVNAVLTEINQKDGTDYCLSDVYYDFDREIMTNATDNATIEKIDAEKQQIQVNIMLGLNGVLDDETIIQSICDILDIDYEEIKSKLPEPEEENTESALNTINQVVPEEDIGGDPVE